jgi:hypothetical protein
MTQKMGTGPAYLIIVSRNAVLGKWVSKKGARLSSVEVVVVVTVVVVVVSEDDDEDVVVGDIDVVKVVGVSVIAVVNEDDDDVRGGCGCKDVDSECSVAHISVVHILLPSCHCVTGVDVVVPVTVVVLVTVVVVHVKNHTCGCRGSCIVVDEDDVVGCNACDCDSALVDRNSREVDGVLGVLGERDTCDVDGVLRVLKDCDGCKVDGVLGVLVVDGMPDDRDVDDVLDVLGERDG